MKLFLQGIVGLARLVGRGLASAARLLASLLGPASYDGPGMKRWLLRVAVLLLLVGGGGFLVAASGVVPIKASSGHWPITAWLLEFSMGRSVSLHSLGVKAPPLDDPALVLRGAGHYETGCFGCHGSPALRQPRVAAAMTPHPPYLAGPAAEWAPEELFYIVKHGVKFTGMPAWPTPHRDDEVWAMVAFLQRFPELDAAEYRRLTRGETAEGDPDDGPDGKRDGGAEGDAAPLRALSGEPSAPAPTTPAPTTPAIVRQSCARCHGVDGQGRGVGAFPRLAGQRREYLAASLEAYAAGRRHSGIMAPIAAGLGPADVRAVADYYSQLSPPAAPAARDSAASHNASLRDARQRGAALARQGVPDRRIPACADCHGPSDHPRNPHYPRLNGQ